MPENELADLQALNQAFGGQATAGDANQGQGNGYAQTVTQNGVTSTVPALERTSSKVIVRPVAAAGFKSYLSERAFVRTEGSTMFGGDGSPYIELRIGVGVDF